MTNAPALAPDRQTRLYLYLIIAFGLCLRLVYFSEDIGGSHTFRQAMVANQIDSLKAQPYPGPKLGFLERYDQTYDFGIVFYDTPIYQYVAAKVSDILNIGAVRAGRLVNLAIFVGISLIFYEILTEIGIRTTASLLTTLLLALSPLSIQNTFGLYPDILATFTSYLSFYLLLRYERERWWGFFYTALVLGVASTLIKLSIYSLFAVAYAWNLIWAARWRVLRRVDAILFGLVIAAAVAAFVLERSYFNYGQISEAANYNESFRLSWYLGPVAERFELEPWRDIGERFMLEYLFPPFMPLALMGLWRVVRQFVKKPRDPQRTLLGLVVGSFVMIVIFFNVFFRHDYYALPLLPIYCALASVGLLNFYALIGSPFAANARAFAFMAVAAIFGSIYYAYSLQSLNYRGNRMSIEIGKSLQELVPADGYVLYLTDEDVSNPEYLYYARRRGVLANFNTTDTRFVSQTVKDHRWDPDNTYLFADAIRLLPNKQDQLKLRLDRYELRELGTSAGRGIVYKLIPRG